MKPCPVCLQCLRLSFLRTGRKRASRFETPRYWGRSASNRSSLRPQKRGLTEARGKTVGESLLLAERHLAGTYTASAWRRGWVYSEHPTPTRNTAIRHLRDRRQHAAAIWHRAMPQGSLLPTYQASTNAGANAQIQIYTRRLLSTDNPSPLFPVA